MANSLLQVTESQLNKLFKLLDEKLKNEGLEALQEVVEVYNALVSAVSVPEKREIDQAPVEKPSEVAPDALAEEEWSEK